MKSIDLKEIRCIIFLINYYFVFCKILIHICMKIKRISFISQKINLFMSYDNYFYLVEFKLKILSI